MKEVVVLSGKGGTGKTSIVGCFAALASSKVLADCDVDAADLHLLLNPSVREKKEFWSGQTAFIDEKSCTQCGMCETVCRFGAIKDLVVSPLACEGCAFCVHVCPEHCITMKERMAGYWYISDTRHGPLVHAQLGIAEENSGKLVTMVKQQARLLAHGEGRDLLIVDGPPGIGCPVISTISGADLVLVVAEPTVSGVHDMQRILETALHFRIPAQVCVNKADIYMKGTHLIEAYCHDHSIELVGQIPFDETVTQAMLNAEPVTSFCPGAPASSPTGRTGSRTQPAPGSSSRPTPAAECSHARGSSQLPSPGRSPALPTPRLI